MTTLGVGQESCFFHFSFQMCTNAKHLNRRRSFNDSVIPDPCEAWDRVLPTINPIGVPFFRSTACQTADALYFFKSLALSSMHPMHPMIMHLICSTTVFGWGVNGIVIAFKITSHFRYSANFLEVYSPPASERNRLTYLPDCLSSIAIHSLSSSTGSNLCPLCTHSYASWRCRESAANIILLWWLFSGDHMCQSALAAKAQWRGKLYSE